MLTGSLYAVHQLLGLFPAIAEPSQAVLSGAAQQLLALLSVVNAVWARLFAGVCGGLLGWWVAHFAVRYGKGLWHCYSAGAEFRESLLLMWSATGGRVGNSSQKAQAGGSAFMGLLLPKVPCRLSWLCAALLGVVAFVLAGRWGLAWVFWVALSAFAVLLALAVIDAQTTLLPDTLTLGLLWLGLLAAWVPGLALVGLHSAVLGAAAGYGFLWLLFWLYWLLRKQEGMGRGDFKLMAALGAWLGWQSLPQVLLLACLASMAYLLFFVAREARAEARAFGPFLAAAALPAVYFHPAFIS